jgi:HD-like signal output (HDOD) protein
VRFAAEMKKEDPDLRLLATLIGNDVALSAAIINTVNSPFYGGRRKASNVQQALYVLGLQRSAHLIARLLLRNAFPAGSGAMMQHFWDESTRMATTADDLAPHIAGIDGDIAHTYALFRDCGMAVMIGKFPNYEQLVDINAGKPGMTLLLAEEAHYRFNHGRVGYALGNSWLLPEFLCNAILLHHDIERFTSAHCDTASAEARLVAFGMLVEQVAALRDHGGLVPDWIPSELFVLRSLGLTPEDIVLLCEQTATEEA